MTDSTPGAHSSSSSSSSSSKLPTLCLTRDIDYILFFDIIDSLQCNGSALSTQRSAPTCGTRPSPWCPRLDDHRQQGYCCAICAVNPRCVNDTPSAVFDRVRDLVMALSNLVAFASNVSPHLSLLWFILFGLHVDAVTHLQRSITAIMPNRCASTFSSLIIICL